MPDLPWIFDDGPFGDRYELPHDVRSMHDKRYVKSRHYFSREEIVSHVREIDDGLALAIRMEDE